jgi:hypothetical protein
LITTKASKSKSYEYLRNFCRGGRLYATDSLAAMDRSG